MKTLKLSELEGLTSEQILTKLECTFSPLSTSPNGAVKQLKEKIDALEVQYGFSSEEMLEHIARGNFEETVEIANWAIDYNTLQELLTTLK